MRKYVICAALIAAAMAVSGCTGADEDSLREKTENPLVMSYLELAEEYAADGDMESAISTLEEGYSETASKRIKNRLDELINERDAEKIAWESSPSVDKQ